MKTLALSLLLAAAAVAEPAWVAEAPEHHDTRLADDLRGTLWATVLDTPQNTSLQAYLTKDLITGKARENPIASNLAIDLELIAPSAKFIRLKAAGMARSVARMEDYTLTRTVVINRNDPAVFIHLLANKPGALTFKVEAGDTAKVENRRELVLTEPSPCRITVWPFESDVTPEAHAISVRGEGEALIVWNFGPANLWDDLAKRYDPGSTPPNPAKIWRGLFDDQTLAAIPPLGQPPPH